MMGRCKNSTEGQIYLSHEKEQLLKPAQTVLLHIEDVTVDGVPTAQAIFDSSTDKKDADFMEERRLRLAQTRTTPPPPSSMRWPRAALAAAWPATSCRRHQEVGCSVRAYNRAYAGAGKRCGRITKKAIGREMAATGGTSPTGLNPMTNFKKITTFLCFNLNVGLVAQLRLLAKFERSPPVEPAMLAKFVTACFAIISDVGHQTSLQ